MIEQAQIHFRDPAGSTIAMMLCQTLHGCMIVLTDVDWHFRKFIQKDHEEHVDSDGLVQMLGKFIQQDFILSLKSQALIDLSKFKLTNIQNLQIFPCIS